MKIYILGFMGAGKTTFGKKLAKALKYEFRDLDREIEAVSGMGSGDLMRLKGEDDFRELESACLKKTAFPENTVIATGGGTPCFFDNISWMKENGVTLYIKVPEGVLQQRLATSSGDRPLLLGKNGEELKTLISKLLSSRIKYYEQAHLHISWEELSVDKVLALFEKNGLKT